MALFLLKAFLLPFGAPASAGSIQVSASKYCSMKNRCFNAIAQSAPHCHLLTEGSLIGERKEAALQYLLFQKGPQYIEVIIAVFDGRIMATNYFQHTGMLEPYLTNISLHNLL